MKDGHKVKSMSFSKHTYMQTDSAVFRHCRHPTRVHLTLKRKEKNENGLKKKRMVKKIRMFIKEQ